MPEYIERGAAKHAADLAFDMTETEYDILCKELDRVPTADVIERPQWISVEDELPDANEDVLLYFDGCLNMVVGGLYFGTGWYANVTGDRYTDCFNPNINAGKIQPPTHWMPLPEQPDGTGEELP